MFGSWSAAPQNEPTLRDKTTHVALKIKDKVYLRAVTKKDLETFDSFLLFVRNQPEMKDMKSPQHTPLSYSSCRLHLLRDAEEREVFVGISHEEDFQLAMNGAARLVELYEHEFGKGSSSTYKGPLAWVVRVHLQ